MEARFRPYFKPSSKLRMSSFGRPAASGETAHQRLISVTLRHEQLTAGLIPAKFSQIFNGSRPETDRQGALNIHLDSRLDLSQVGGRHAAS
jgi:hypothetical protein